jgi:uncharacterized protein Yka (UPF0111/DUF47 family)
LAADAAIASMQCVPKRLRPSHEIAELIDRIRQLVDERRRLEGVASREEIEANEVEIDCLQTRLAAAVQRSLTGPMSSETAPGL